MEPKSVDFNDKKMEISQEEEYEICAKYPKEFEVWCESSKKYYKVEKLINEKNMENEFWHVVSVIKKLFENEVNRIGITFKSGHYVGEDWIERSIRKQLYYFLSNEELPKDYKYNIGNPLTEWAIREEIVNRAIGWEYWFNDRGGYEIKWREDKVISSILESDEYKSSFQFPKSYDLREGQISSWGLEKLGRRIREIVN